MKSSREKICRRYFEGIIPEADFDVGSFSSASSKTSHKRSAPWTNGMLLIFLYPIVIGLVSLEATISYFSDAEAAVGNTLSAASEYPSDEAPLLFFAQEENSFAPLVLGEATSTEEDIHDEEVIPEEEKPEEEQEEKEEEQEEVGEDIAEEEEEGAESDQVPEEKIEEGPEEEMETKGVQEEDPLSDPEA